MLAIFISDMFRERNFKLYPTKVHKIFQSAHKEKINDHEIKKSKLLLFVMTVIMNPPKFNQTIK